MERKKIYSILDGEKYITTIESGEPSKLEQILRRFRKNVLNFFYDKKSLKITINVNRELDGEYKKDAGYSGELGISMDQYSQIVGNLQKTGIEFLDKNPDRLGVKVSQNETHSQLKIISWYLSMKNG